MNYLIRCLFGRMPLRRGVVGALVLPAVFALAMMMSATVPAHASGGWCGQEWDTIWSSSNGPYASKLHLVCTPGSNAVSGNYNDGTVTGAVQTDAAGASTFTGAWARSVGSAGSSKGCQGGNFVLDLAPDGLHFDGFWSYCSDPATPRSAHDQTAWKWTGRASIDQSGLADLDIETNINACTSPSPANSGFDQNGFMLNPTFVWYLRDCARMAPNGPTPDEAAICAPHVQGVIQPNLCIDQPLTTDDVGANAFDVGPFCQAPPYADDHVNWGATPVTLTGALYWNEAEGGWPNDGDYDFELGLPPGPLVTANGGTVHSEFSSDEVINKFANGWWNSFHDAVDHSKDRTHSMIDGRQTIITGLLGTDWVHAPKVESHPIYAMAIEIDDSARDNVWVFFARNWGNEGMCSSQPHSIPIANFEISIPTRSEKGVLTWDDVWTVDDNATAPASIDFTSGPETVLTLPLSQPSDSPLIYGDIHIDWGPNAAPGPIDGEGAPRPNPAGPGVVPLSNTGGGTQSRILRRVPGEHETEADEPEHELAGIMALLSADQQKRVLVDVPDVPHADHVSRKISVIVQPRSWRRLSEVVPRATATARNPEPARRLVALVTAICRESGKPVLQSGHVTLDCTRILAAQGRP